MYALVMIGVIAYLWYSGRWRQKLGWLLLVISAFLGFLIFSPVAPWQFQQLCCVMYRDWEFRSLWVS